MKALTQLFTFLSYVYFLRCIHEDDTSIDSGVASISLNKNRLDFLYNDILKKEHLKVEEIEKAFCLDLELGETYDNLIISCLKAGFEDTTHFSSFFLKTFVKFMNCPLLFEIRIPHFQLLKRDTYIYFKKSGNLENSEKRRIDLLVNFIYLAFPKVLNSDYEVDFGKFLFSISKSDPKKIKKETDLPSITEGEDNLSTNPEISKDSKSLEDEHIENIKKYVGRVKDLAALYKDLVIEVFGQEFYDVVSKAIIELINKENAAEYLKEIGKKYEGRLKKIFSNDDSDN